MKLKAAHIADVHFPDAGDLLKEVITCSGSAAESVEKAKPDFMMITGDLYDHRMILDSPGALAASRFVQRLAAVCPVLIIRGTDMHDFDSLESLRGLPNVMVVSDVRQVLFSKGKGFYDCNKKDGIPDAIFSCLPSPSKAFLVSLGTTAEQAQEEVVDLVRKVLRGWGEVNTMMRGKGVVTVLTGHGTIAGSVTSTGQVMVGRDLEYGTADLALANCDYQAWGHIHRAQKIGSVDLPAWYAGSLGRLDAGEQEEKGFLMVDLAPGEKAVPKFIQTPARKYLILDLGKDPEHWQDEMKSILSASTIDDNTVIKVKASLSESRGSTITRKDLEAIAGKEVIFDKTVIPIQRTRAEGISTLKTSREKYIKWAETSDQPHNEDMLARVDLLDKPVEDIVAAIKQKFYPEELKVPVQQAVAIPTDNLPVEAVAEPTSVTESSPKRKSGRKNKSEAPKKEPETFVLA